MSEEQAGYRTTEIDSPWPTLLTERQALYLLGCQQELIAQATLVERQLKRLAQEAASRELAARRVANAG